MATVGSYLHALDVQVKRPIYYSQGPGRYHPDLSGYADCSGLVCYGYTTVGEGIGDANSWQIAVLAHQKRLGIPVDVARITPGALLFIGADEGQVNIQDRGHIGTSCGNGLTVEARSHIRGVGYFGWNSNRWDWACLPIGLHDYSTPPPIVAPPKEVPLVSISTMIPGTHAQTKDPWKGRKPVVQAVHQIDGTWDLLGVNGASLAGGTPVYGLSVFHLGRLNAPITNIQPEQDVHGHFSGMILALAEDGGTFGVTTTVHYL